MPVIVAAFIGALAQAMGSFVGRVLIALGLGFASYKGFDSLISSMKDHINSLISSFGASSLSHWAGFFQIDKHFSIIMSAITTKVIMNGLKDGTKFLVNK